MRAWASSPRDLLARIEALRVEQGQHWREADSLSASYLIRANPPLTYAYKPRTETEEKACSSERAKEAVR